MIERDWYGLYKERWFGLIVPEASCHPAKFWRALIRRIYEHATEQGWLAEGDKVADPFGGVALGALHAMQLGLHWRGVELEEKFVDLGKANIALWNERYGGHLPKWGTAGLVQGDSRGLCSRMEMGVTAIVSSPPYSKCLSCPLAGGLIVPRNYGGAGGQLGAMKDGAEVAAWQLGEGYGGTDGQLAGLPEGSFEGMVSSPPYESQNACNHPNYKTSGGPFYGDYGGTEGQPGRESGDTFWSASLLIMQQVYTLLKPGGVAIWVCKRFIRDKQIVEFSQQWAQLGIACGFEPVEWIRAWLVEERANVTALFDFEVETKDAEGSITRQAFLAGTPVRYENRRVKDPMVERKSFFRRLVESKGTPRIDWEDVIVQRKPA